MGCIGFHYSHSTYDLPKVETRVVEKIVEIPSLPPPPNPNPKRFKILNHLQDGKFLILLINYPDCVNYEGNKILVFKDVWLEDLIDQKSIDPHFSDNPKKISPIARFVPTIQGWLMAVKLVDVLHGKK